MQQDLDQSVVGAVINLLLHEESLFSEALTIHLEVSLDFLPW